MIGHTNSKLTIAAWAAALAATLMLALCAAIASGDEHRIESRRRRAGDNHG